MDEEEEEEGEWTAHENEKIPEETIPDSRLQDLYDLNNDPQQSFAKRKLMDSSIAKQQLKRSILEAATELTNEFHGPYMSRLLMSDPTQNLIDSLNPSSSFDTIKKGFLFHLNSTGQYLALREHLRVSVTQIIQQSGLLVRPSGFQNPRQFQTFLHDMYIYLTDQLHDTLNETKLNEVGTANWDDPPPKTPYSWDHESRQGNDPESHLLLFAEEAFLQGDMENCHRLHLQRICQDTKNPLNWLHFAIMWCARGDDRMAEISLREALKLDPKCVNALLLAGIIAARHQDDRAINLIGSALELRPLSPEVYVLLAVAHRLLGSAVNSKYFFLKARLLHLTLTGQERERREVENDLTNFSFDLQFNSASSLISSSNQQSNLSSSDLQGGKKKKKKKKSKVKKKDEEGSKSSNEKKRSKKKRSKGQPENDNKSNSTISAAGITPGSLPDSDKSGRGSSKKSGRKKKSKDSINSGQNPEGLLKDENALFTQKDSITGRDSQGPGVNTLPKPAYFDWPVEIREDNVGQSFLPTLGPPTIQFTWDVTQLPFPGSRGEDYHDEGEEEEGIFGQRQSKLDHYQVGSRKFERKESEDMLEMYNHFVTNPSSLILSGDNQNLLTGLSGGSEPGTTNQTPRSGRKKKKKGKSPKGSRRSSKEFDSSSKKSHKGRKSNPDSRRSSKSSGSEGSDGKKKRKRSSKAKNQRQLEQTIVNPDEVNGEDKNGRIWTTRHGSEYIWTAQLLLQFHAYDFLDGILARELFYTKTRSVPFLYILAMSLLNRKREKVALPFLEEALSYDPDNPYVWELKGYCHQAVGENDLAIQCYEKSIQGMTHSTHNRHLTYLRLGMACAAMDKTKLAKSILLKGVTFYPSLYMWIELGNASYKIFDYAEAEAAFGIANRLDNSNPEIWGLLALVNLAQGNVNLSEQSYKWAVRFGLKNESLLNEIKQMQEERGYGDPSFPQIPSCIPHRFYVKRLGRERPLDLYREAIQTPDHQRRKAGSKVEETSREKELMRRLENWKKRNTADTSEEEEEEEEEEITEEEEEEDPVSQNTTLAEPESRPDPWATKAGKKEIPFSRKN